MKTQQKEIIRGEFGYDIEDPDYDALVALRKMFDRRQQEIEATKLARKLIAKDRTSAVAKKLWELAGCPANRDEDFWFAAEELTVIE